MAFIYCPNDERAAYETILVILKAGQAPVQPVQVITQVINKIKVVTETVFEDNDDDGKDRNNDRDDRDRDRDCKDGYERRDGKCLPRYCDDPKAIPEVLCRDEGEESDPVDRPICQQYIGNPCNGGPVEDPITIDNGTETEGTVFEEEIAPPLVNDIPTPMTPIEEPVNEKQFLEDFSTSDDNNETSSEIESKSESGGNESFFN
jgi:hypothetical protein